MKKNITKTLIDLFKNKSFTLTDAYLSCPNTPQPSVRARIYEGLDVAFERIDKGVYRTIWQDEETEEAILIEGDGRDLSFLQDSSIDMIMTDHPWSDTKSNKGGTRNFANYDVFKYTQEDFTEKARVLKDGSFLVEMIPLENKNNMEYLYQLKQMAINAGFEYYAKVPWKKGTFIANTGRTSKNMEDVMIFTKGKPRALRPDAKKIKASNGVMHYMSGAKEMLPTVFDYQPPSKNERLHQSEKPVSLVEKLISLFSLENEIVLDQFAGSGVTLDAATNINRKVIGIELATEFCTKIKERFKNKNKSLVVLSQQ